MFDFNQNVEGITKYIVQRNPNPSKRFNLERKITEALRELEMTEFDSLVLRDKINTRYAQLKMQQEVL